MKNALIKNWFIGSVALVAIAAGFFWVQWFAHAQLIPPIPPIPPIPNIPTVGSPQLPFLNSPYVLNTSGIIRNQNNTWDIPFVIPVNTQAAQFLLMVNNTTIGGGQILQGQLVFKAPGAAFGNAGFAMVGLKNMATGQVVAMNAVFVLNQLVQSPQYSLNQNSITQNSDGSWNVGYNVPVNSVANELVLAVGSNKPLTNGLSAYGGVVFRVPESYFVGQSLELTLASAVTGQTLAANVVFIPQSNSALFQLDQSLIRQNQNGTWDIVYRVPTNSNARNFSVTPGTAGLVANGAIVSGNLVFKVPEESLVAGSKILLVLKDETTGQIRASDTITVPNGLGVQYSLTVSDITAYDPKAKDLDWRIPWMVPPNTISTDFVMVNSTKATYTNGQMLNNQLVFRVPQSELEIGDMNGLVLKNIKNGRSYTIDGVMTQGPIPNAPQDTSKYVGGLLITFPPADQNIKQTSATIKPHIRALMDLPYVDLTYVWSKTGDPAANVEAPLFKVLGPVGMKMSEEQTGLLSFTGLTAGTTYTFVVKNNITNTISDPVKFTTPTTANEKGYLSYTGGMVDYTASGGNDAPAGGPAIVDDISDKGIVPPCGRTVPDDASDELKKQAIPCGYQDFMQLISNILRYALIIFGPIAAVLILYSGFVIMILGRIPDPTAEQEAALRAAKTRLVKIAIGIAIILSAWVLIATITRELGVKSSYSLLDLFTGN